MLMDVLRSLGWTREGDRRGSRIKEEDVAMIFKKMDLDSNGKISKRVNMFVNQNTP